MAAVKTFVSLFVVVSLIGCSLSTKSDGLCGGFRPHIRFGVDQDAHRIDLSPSSATAITVGDLVADTSALHSDLPDDVRHPNAEDRLFVVSARVSAVSRSDAGTIVTLEDGEGHAMSAVTPSLRCVPESSPFATLIRDTATSLARRRFVGQNVRAFGVLFYGAHSKQDATNGIQMNPLLHIESIE